MKKMGWSPNEGTFLREKDNEFIKHLRQGMSDPNLKSHFTYTNPETKQPMEMNYILNPDGTYTRKPGVKEGDAKDDAIQGLIDE